MKNCVYEDVHCTNPECTEVMPRRTLQYHLVSKCRWRVVSCHFCAEMYTYKDSKVRFGNPWAQAFLDFQNGGFFFVFVPRTARFS